MAHNKAYFLGLNQLEKHGICIHNTGNNLSAKEVYQELETKGMLYTCHYIIDEEEIIETTSNDFPSFHTGKAYDKGNYETISIEICRSTDCIETYLKAQNRAKQLIKSLMKKYHLSLENIYFHNDFDEQTYCPHRILDLYGNKQNFIEKEMKNND